MMGWMRNGWVGGLQELRKSGMKGLDTVRRGWRSERE